MSAGPPPRRAFRADRGDAGERLDRVLLRHLADLPALSRTKIQSLVASGNVLVNGSARTRGSDRVRAGDDVTVELPAPPPPPPDLLPQDIPLSVLYEDEHLLVLDKPAGLVVHPAVGHRDGTLVNALLFRSREWGGAAERPGLVHRLDKDTSGVLMVARTDAAHAGIARAMKARTIEKEYLAVVYGRPPVVKGRVDLRILRDRADRKRMTTSKTEGRESSTLYELLGESGGDRGGVSLLKCLLLTGRTHQIRVHLKAIHLPVVGDPVYGSPRWKGIRDEALKAACRDFPRQALHARRLALAHPVTAERLELVAPVPPDIARLLAAAGLGLPARSR
ncbi:MAG: RluA family pseudouridine synthase [Acidobacteria bacterium]|nr:MAG: RluA family pseudouridine synthase [Acidobacteriota bacterium]